MIRAQHDLASADLSDKVTQRLGREHERVVIELSEVFGR